jgi:hypothetical protein
MTKTEAKKIAIEEFHSRLNACYYWFETEFDSGKYTEKEQELILSQAYKLSERLIKIVAKK